MIGLDFKWYDIKKQSQNYMFRPRFERIGMITQDVIQLILTSVASTSCSFEMRNTFLAEEKANVEMKYG